MKDLIKTIIGVGIAIGLIWLIKWVFLPHEDLQPNNKHIFHLEVLVVFIFLGMYFIGEVFHVYEYIHKRSADEQASPPKLGWHDVFLLLSALAGSLIIYVAFVKLMSGDGAG